MKHSLKTITRGWMLVDDTGKPVNCYDDLREFDTKKGAMAFQRIVKRNWPFFSPARRDIVDAHLVQTTRTSVLTWEKP